MGLFLQLVDEVSEDLTVPPGPATFGRILRAQADGDAQALSQKGRRVASVNLGADAIGGIATLTGTVGGLG